MDSSSEEEDPNVCPVCDDRNDPNPIDNKNRMIGCDGRCEKWFHWSCVGINQENKPGKNDDWFCKKCTARKTDSSEWRPDVADEEALDVLPARDSPGQTFKTLAQKKSYDSYGELPKKSPGRPAAAAAGPRSKIDRKSTESKTSNSKSRESWSTVQSSPKLPPGISVSSHGASSQISVGNGVKRALPSSVTERSEKVTKLPAGISISIASETPPHHSQSSKRANISPPKSDSSNSQPRKSPTARKVEEDRCEDTFLTDFLEDVGAGDSKPSRDDCASSPLPGIKLIKVNERNNIERQLRERGQQVAAIKATLEEGDISDDQLFGNKKLLYKKPSKPSQSNHFEPTPVEELLKDVDVEKQSENQEESNLVAEVRKAEIAGRGIPPSIQSPSDNKNTAKENGENSKINQVNKYIEIFICRFYIICVLG